MNLTRGHLPLPLVYRCFHHRMISLSHEIILDESPISRSPTSILPASVGTKNGYNDDSVVPQPGTCVHPFAPRRYDIE